ncbi:predicted protein [Uncinocarpus reesii 1704]|uniref:Uncharacterized protein n=1 Tax=Uncinocarpus reesii (strain UAMH 1704) TaxID=336963 RepID=C4JD87_UNCRE|nr:uncharacterized protein UREG_00287 [Uncinocarpus reesii 1704]EEP75441.1 predicted protein [Uncinocarpus reesii 1704]
MSYRCLVTVSLMVSPLAHKRPAIKPVDYFCYPSPMPSRASSSPILWCYSEHPTAAQNDALAIGGNSTLVEAYVRTTTSDSLIYEATLNLSACYLLST